jgi:peptidoglycan hydrolase-like protein with peptidoglycan-binding domain
MTFTPNSSTIAKLNKPVLQKGSTGEAVKELQNLLNHYNSYNIPVDGVFGDTTKNEVISFQNRMFLLQDGIVGDKTWQVLFKGAPVDMPALKKGSKGDLVKRIQERMCISGDYKQNPSGIFDTDTEKAVKGLQKRTKLPVDGVVGDRTWFELGKIDPSVGGC